MIYLFIIWVFQVILNFLKPKFLERRKKKEKKEKKEIEKVEKEKKREKENSHLCINFLNSFIQRKF